HWLCITTCFGLVFEHPRAGSIRKCERFRDGAQQPSWPQVRTGWQPLCGGRGNGRRDFHRGCMRTSPRAGWPLHRRIHFAHPDDFEHDGTWYSMVAVRGKLYAVEPNHGELDVISPSGEIRRVADISATQGHIVPTSIAYHGNFFVGNLNTFPIQDGSSKILKF